ncbi:rRNA maturation RNase YbeY [Akkermansiaceae bacterium]|nr:rRNA maturation RNase YbeY [Akkermansiaceae bacterium]
MSEMQFEIHPTCQSREFTDQLLSILHSGWSEVAEVLRKIGVGKIVTFSEFEISLLDDEEMARVHGEFLKDPTTTDVITFQHGELLIGVEVAERQSIDYGASADLEIALYGIHGMLHLSGFDDRSPEDAELMKARQEELLEVYFKGLF